MKLRDLPASSIGSSPLTVAVLLISFTIRVSLAQTTLQSSVSKDGITWTFDHAVPVGQFVNGDYYVVGPVTVVSIDPPPTTASPYINGSVLNLPTSDGKSGFDERLNDGVDESWWFNSSDRSDPPIALTPGDSLVSSISLTTAQYHNVPEVMRSGDNSISPVGSVSILTVLNSAVTSDAFRPSYCDRSQTIYYANSLQRQLLPALTPPNPSMTPPLSQFENWFRRPWIDMNPFLFDAPALYMPSYGQHIAFADSYVGLLLELNFPPDQKVNLTNYFVQYGVDLYGCVQAGYGWPAFGGHRSGRKMPIVFAGVLLNNASMKNVSSLYPDEFGEDMQTLYINKLPPAGTYAQAWQGATVIYGGHYGVHADGALVSAGLYGPYEQLQPNLWPLINGNEQLGEAYRRCCTSVSWVGEALAMRILGAQDIWNYPAFFDYVDRWMFEDDTQAIAQIKAQSGFDYSADWERQGQTQYWLQGEFPQYSFVDDMWHAYRNTVSGGPPAMLEVGINAPAAWSVVSGAVNVGGWALNTAGSDYTYIASVQVSVDGSVAGNASYGLNAAAACATESSPACPNVGYSFLLDTSAMAGGIHSLHVAATDSDVNPDTGSADSTFLVAGTSGSSVAGHPGVVWQDPGTGTSELWFLGGTQGTAVIGGANLNTKANTWRIVGMADFDGDGHPDVVWQDPASGTAQVWFLGGVQGATRTGAAVLSGANAWQIAAVADLDGDGHPDLVWQDPATGQSQVWFMNGAQGATVRGSAVLSKPNSWRIVGAADFDGNGHADLVWQDPATGVSQVWFMGGAQGTTVIGAAALSKPNAWRIARVMDFNGDGHPDLIWQDPTTGESQAWLLGGTQGVTLTGAAVLAGPTPLRISR